jgi:hypothetical protein
LEVRVEDWGFEVRFRMEFEIDRLRDGLGCGWM